MSTQTNSMRCATDVRRMILTGHFLPGQKIHQEQLASQLQMSRVPVREALSLLESEGLLTYQANTGYTVTRFSRQDLDEIYLMRDLLENELLKSYDLRSVDVDLLRELNAELASTRIDEERSRFDDLNQQFHFTLFAASPLARVRDEVERLWRLSTFYRATTWNGPDAQARVIAEHEQIIAAAEARDTDAIVEACASHRGSTSTLMQGRTWHVEATPRGPA